MNCEGSSVRCEELKISGTPKAILLCLSLLLPPPFLGILVHLCIFAGECILWETGCGIRTLICLWSFCLCSYIHITLKLVRVGTWKQINYFWFIEFWPCCLEDGHSVLRHIHADVSVFSDPLWLYNISISSYKWSPQWAPKCGSGWGWEGWGVGGWVRFLELFFIAIF